MYDQSGCTTVAGGVCCDDSPNKRIKGPNDSGWVDQNAEPQKAGLVAWLQIVGAAFLFFNTWGAVVSFGIFQNYYQETLLSNYSPSDISWIGTTQVFLLNIVGIVSGPLYDMGYLRLLLIVGSILTVFGYMMASFANSYIAAYFSVGVAIGLGTGCLFTPSLSIAASYFNTKAIPIAVGFASTGTCFGGVIYPIIFRTMLDRVSYGWACRTMGFVALATLSVSIMLMRPINNTKAHRKLLDTSAFKDSPFILFTIAMFFFCTALYIPFYYIPQFAQQHLYVDEQTAFFLLAIQNGASIFGRFIPGLAAARFGALQTLLACSVVAATLVFAWIGIFNMPGLVVFLILYGNFAGGVISLTAACVVALSPDMKLAGTRIGMNAGFYAFGLLVGNPIAGVIVQTSEGFVGQAVFAGLTLVVGLAFAISALILHVRKKSALTGSH